MTDGSAGKATGPSPRLAIVGSTDLARLLAHHARGAGCTIEGFFDNRRPAGDEVGDYGVVLGTVDDVLPLFERGRFDILLIGVGYLQARYRREAFDRFKGRIPFYNLIHGSAVLGDDCVLGEGIVLLPGCVLDTGVMIGDNVLLNTAVIVAHHTSIGSHSFIGPAAAIAGKVTIGSQCFVGTNATIVDHRQIADGITIGAGSLVINDLEEQGVYFGAPARLQRRTSALSEHL